MLFFIIATSSAGWLYFELSKTTPKPLLSPLEGIYHVLTLTFLQSNLDFPAEWYLQIFHFLMPIIGVGILAQGLADFGVLLFNRRARGKEWEMAVASTFKNHVILVGLGHLGYRVVRKLHEMAQDVVVIDLNPNDEANKIDLIESIKSLGIPVIQDDASREPILRAAGIQSAHSIILCTQNDNLNLQIALKARTINPNIRVVLRIFDDEFAQSLQKQFGFIALSATGMAAPVFAASAANIDITPPLTIDGQPHSLARIKIPLKSRLSGKSVEEIENQYQISIVLINRVGQKQFHPSGEMHLTGNDDIVVLGAPEQINLLIHKNNL